MGALAKSLERLLSIDEPQQTVTAAPEKSHRPASDDSRSTKLVPPADLSGMPLAYALHEAGGGKILGSPTSGFAFFNNVTENLVIVSEDDKKIVHATLGDWISHYAMVIAKEGQATFIVHGDEVICSIRGFSESGDSYSEAAMRALLAYRRAERATDIASC